MLISEEELERRDQDTRMEKLKTQQQPESMESREDSKKADPPRPGPDYIAWRIRWEERFGFKRQM